MVSVYTRPVAHSSVDTLKAKFILNGSPERITQTILDYPTYPAWYEDYSHGEIIERVSVSEYIVRFVIDVPFRFQTRDSMHRVVVRESDDQVQVDLTSESHFFAPQNGFVRMRVSLGRWI